jgi:hypothetical protein
VSPAPLTTLFGQPLNGTGPVFLMTVGNASAGTIPVGSPGGWLGQKTPWWVERRYTGPLLIRGSRLDKPGSVRFAKVSGQHLPELRFPAGEDNGLQKPFRFLASGSTFRTAGCYGFQADGTSFSEVIVMRVVYQLFP